MSNFELSSKLRLFLSLSAENLLNSLGEKLPVSIRKRYSCSQTMVIFPEAEYQFFVRSEMTRLFSLADVLGLDAIVSCENGVPVIEITDYDVNEA